MKTTVARCQHQSLMCGVLLISSALLPVTGCQNDFSAPLPNGYQLARTNACTILIMPPPERSKSFAGKHGVAVAAKIDRLAVVGSIVFGYVVSSPDSECADIESPGYFVLDTKQDSVLLGLDEAELQEELKQLGITEWNLRSPRSFK